MDLAPRQFLADLVSAPGPVGHEAPVVKAWLAYVKPFADETFTDAYGNGFAVLNPKGDPCVMLTGHADELGLMVTHIDDEGFLWVGSLGGYDAKVLPAMRVRVFGSAGASREPLAGVIGAMPPHMQHPELGDAELKRYRFGENVYIDIGAKDKATAQAHVRVGDPVILDYGFAPLRQDLVVGRGLDNKIGLWATAEGLRLASLKRDKLKARVVAMAAVQEEIGGHGATMAAYRIEPDLAVAVDVTQSIDHPGTDKKRWGDARMGRGPVLARGSACHPELVGRIERLARRLRIDLQYEASPAHTGTDADSIFLVKGGIPTAVVSLPQRYMHSPAEMVNLKDLESIARILGELCVDLKPGERFAVRV
jgi:endoglucanase